MPRAIRLSLPNWSLQRNQFYWFICEYQRWSNNIVACNYIQLMMQRVRNEYMYVDSVPTYRHLYNHRWTEGSFTSTKKVMLSTGYLKSYRRTLVKFCGFISIGPRTNQLHFGGEPNVMMSYPHFGLSALARNLFLIKTSGYNHICLC